MRSKDNNVDEQKWIKEIQKGDEQAFEQFFKSYYFRLSRFAWRYLGSKAIAEELVQELFTEIWEKRASWEPLNVLVQ